MLKRKMLEALLIICIPRPNITLKTLQSFDLSIRETAIGKKDFSTSPSVFNVPNKALIT